MTKHDAVLYERRGPVAWLTINRPEKANALNEAVRHGLFQGLRRFKDDNEAAVLVLTGAGEKAFCAGADLDEMQRTQLEVPDRDFVPELGFNIQVDKITIAAVNGVARAGGFLLAQNCDLCIASEDATFAVTEARVGRGFPWSVPLPSLISSRVALELLVTAEMAGAQRMHDLGFVNAVVEKAELVDHVQRFAEGIARNAPLTVRAAKETVRLRQEMGLSDAYERAQQLWRAVYSSEDAQEGPRAFNEGREPVWQGR